MSVRYEKTDVSVSDTVRIGIVVFAIAAVASLILLPLMWVFEARSAQQDPPMPPLARFEPGRKPPEPRLQERPFDDWRELRAEQQDWLSHYGWVDRDAGIVRMPIDDAMHLMLERGLPVRPGAAPATFPPVGNASPVSEAEPSAEHPDEGGH